MGCLGAQSWSHLNADFYCRFLFPCVLLPQYFSILYVNMNDARYNLRNRGECRIPIQLQLASDVDFLTASGEVAGSSQSGQVVTDLSDSGSDIDISGLVEHSDQNLSSSPVISGFLFSAMVFKKLGKVRLHKPRVGMLLSQTNNILTVRFCPSSVPQGPD